MCHLLRRRSRRTIPPEQRKVGAQLSTVDGGSSRLCYALQGLLGLFAIFILFTGAESNAATAGMAAPNALLWVNAALTGVGFASLGLVVASTRDALQPGGMLEKLGVGTTMINARKAKYLSRSRKQLGAFSAFWVLLGLLMVVAGVTGGGLPSSAAVEFRIIFVLLGFIFCTVFPVAFSGWWASVIHTQSTYPM